MQERIITIYCRCEDFLKARGIVADPQAQMSTAEVLTTALVAAAMLGGCFEQRRAFLRSHGYLPHRLSKSRFNRRLHALPEALWPACGPLRGGVALQPTKSSAYGVDSLPVPACDNIGSRRCRLYRGKRSGALAPVNAATSLACAFIA